jgi:hypothetical protein
MPELDATCALCGRTVNALDPYTWRRVVGWERKATQASRKSGSDIALREPLDEYAHSACIRLAQQGLAPTQEVLL